MMNPFIYEYPVKTFFGVGSVGKHLGTLLRGYGENILLAYGGGSIKKNGIYEELTAILRESGKRVTEFSDIMPNPAYRKVQEGAELVRRHQIDFILAAGGGSVIDCCKIVAAQAKLEQDIWEMEFTKHQYPDIWVPMGAVVTASGTGAEMNNGAVITNEEKKIKAGVLGACADFAVLDPAYTLSLPMEQVISGAFDTLSHCMETYFGKPEEICLSDEIGESVMRNTIRNIRILRNDPQSMTARSELMWASAMGENGILKIGKITDFQAHQLEHQLGAYTDCNHGKGLAVIHPVLYRHIYRNHAARFARFAKEVWNIPEEGKTEETLALEGIQALADFIREIGLPTSFTEMGITEESVLRAVADSSNISAGCCKKLSREEMFEILKECL
ncbi:iron-containing alcohol dehydrogenase [Enterocloster sp.]